MRSVDPCCRNLADLPGFCNLGQNSNGHRVSQRPREIVGTKSYVMLCLQLPKVQAEEEASEKGIRNWRHSHMCFASKWYLEA